jgi:hypothetical protein
MKKSLREFVCIAQEQELKRALQPIADAFEKWKNNEISSKYIYEKIRNFNGGSAREIYNKYTKLTNRQLVDQAIDGGKLSSDKIPDDLLRDLANAIESIDKYKKRCRTTG